MCFFTVLDPLTGRKLGSLMNLMQNSKHRARRLADVFQSVETECQANLSRRSERPEDMMVRKGWAASWGQESRLHAKGEDIQPRQEDFQPQ